MGIAKLRVSSFLVEEGLDFPRDLEILGCEWVGENRVILFDISHPDIPEGVSEVTAEVTVRPKEWRF